MFFIKCKDIDERQDLIDHLKASQIEAPFHYVPLHSSPAGLKYGRFSGEDINTTRESERLLRLPLYYGISESDVFEVSSKIEEFYERR